MKIFRLRRTIKLQTKPYWIYVEDLEDDEMLLNFWMPDARREDINIVEEEIGGGRRQIKIVNPEDSKPCVVILYIYKWRENPW